MFKPGPNIYGLINTLLLHVQLIIHYYSYRNNHVHVQTTGSLPMSIEPLTAPFLVVAAFSTISTVAYIEKVTEAPDSFFSGQDEKWIQAYIFWEAALTFCLPGASSCLSLLMNLLEDDLHWILAHWASKKICLSQTTGQDYFLTIMVDNLWDHEFVYMSLIIRDLRAGVYCVVPENTHTSPQSWAILRVSSHANTHF